MTFDDVGTVARIPLKRVVARAKEYGVVALLAVDEIVAVAAKENVGTVASENGIVACTAVDYDTDESCPTSSITTN